MSESLQRNLGGRMSMQLYLSMHFSGLYRLWKKFLFSGRPSLYIQIIESPVDNSCCSFIISIDAIDHFRARFRFSKFLVNFRSQFFNCSMKPSFGFTIGRQARRYSRARFILHRLDFMRKARTKVALRLIPALQCTNTFLLPNCLAMNSFDSEMCWQRSSNGLSYTAITLCDIPVSTFTTNSEATVSTDPILYCFSVNGSLAASREPMKRVKE